jgi:hypothetical protein
MFGGAGAASEKGIYVQMPFFLFWVAQPLATCSPVRPFA